MARLLADLTPPASFTAGTRATVGGKATWFECTEENCVRASGDVTLTVTAGAAATPDPSHKAAFDAVRAARPRNG